MGDASMEFSEGSVLGHFRITKALGRGTFSEIYEAVDQDDESPSSKRVAIKLARESQKCSMLVHEHEVVQCSD